MEALISSKTKLISFLKPLTEQQRTHLYGRWVGAKLLLSDQPNTEQYGALHSISIEINNIEKWWTKIRYDVIVDFRYSKRCGIVIAVHSGVWEAIPDLSLRQAKSAYEICDDAQVETLLGKEVRRAMLGEVYLVGFSARTLDPVVCRRNQAIP